MFNTDRCIESFTPQRCEKIAEVYLLSINKALLLFLLLPNDLHFF